MYRNTPVVPSRRRRSALAATLCTALIGGTIAIGSGALTPIASAATTMSVCPDGTVEVTAGFGIPAPAGVTTMGVKGLLCQAAFTASGTFTTPTGVTKADVLVVGGGGGGGLGGVVNSEVLAGGGGAGGQVALYENVPVTGDISVTVGTGGAGGSDSCDPNCLTTGVDGTDGNGSEFGTSGTYTAAGGDGGLGGTSTGSSPFVAAGGGGNSAPAPLTVMPAGVTATVSSGGAGGTAAGDLMGPDTDLYFSGGGGGAGAGGNGGGADTTTCTTIDGGPACEVYGGDGGIGVLPDGGYFDSDYWFFFDWVWSFDNFMQNFDVENYGFGPGGGGSIASLAVLDPSNGQSLVTYDIGRGVDLAGDPSVMYGQGSDIFAVNMLGTTPYVRPSSSAGLACSWTCGSSYTHAFGAGGGGAVGNSSLAGTSDPLDFGAQAANGDNGIVIVLFDFPIDSDGDGFLSDVDCDDSAPTVNPGATELVGNGYDDDCNAETPIGSDTTLTCDIAPVSTNAVENDFLDLNFTGSNDLGEYATTGDVIGYTSVAAIGGPALATGTLSNLSGSSPTWTATLTVSDTTGISAGDGVTARNGVGDLGAGNVVTVSSVDDGTTLQLTIEGYTDPIEGDVTTIRTGTLVDARLTISDHVTPDNFDIEIVDESSEDGDLNATVSSQLYAYNSLDGTIANVAGAGPWTGEIQGLASTDGFNVGDRFIAGDAYDGWLPGTGGIYTVTGITDTTTITFSAEGGTAPQDGYISGIHSWTSVEYTFDFFEGGSDFVTPIDLNDVSVVVKDVDENQFVEFARPDSIRLEHDSAIEVLSGASSDLVPANNYRFWSAPRSVDTDTPHWVEVSYNTVSSMKVRIGELASGGMSMELAFGPANFTDPITCGTTIIDEVPTTTTYTGDSGRILEGTSMDLSATVDPAECTTPAVTFELTYPDGTTETITDPLDTTGFESGDYQITASYAGDGTCLPSEDTADFYIPYQTVTTYTGGNGLITAGTSVSLSATVTPAECTSPAVTYTITYPDGTSYPASSPLNTSGFGPGIYEIVADYAGDDAACLPSADSTLLVIATPGDSTTGGGIYHVDSGISGTPRINFGFTVQRTVKTDKRTGSTEEIQRGQLLWMNTNQWRLKASLYSRRVTSSGITTGDTPVFGTNPCPVGVGVSGSNPKCGVIVGRGWLERWNSDTLEWEVATDLGRSGWVSFTATIYDGGSVKVCKGKTCSIVDVADWFGMTMAGITTSTGVPVSVPIQVRKQQNGAIVIRV